MSASLQQIKDAFASISKPYCCSGTIPLDPEVSTLFYLNNERSEAIKFTETTDAQLTALAEACQPATFGLGNKDVLDESYRKAGKIDAKDFSLQFSPLCTSVLETIRQSLLQGRLERSETSVRVELYKLNVYGPGSFFRPHVDTPRGEQMFGSLVIVLPTVHEGGSLILRQGQKETIFDTAHAVNSNDTPHAAFVAFYSDVEHEVTLVTSGYRVTITYNLYYLTAPVDEVQTLGPELDSTGTSAHEIAELQTSLKKLLDDATFLPKGGLLGFGLSHKYPFRLTSSSRELGKFANCLKGSDAEVERVCQALGLDVHLKAFYIETGRCDNQPCGLVNDFLDRYERIDVDPEEMSLLDQICEQAGADAMVVYPNRWGDVNYLGGRWSKIPGTPIEWLREFNESNFFYNPDAPYGNAATIDSAYGDVCLVANVKTAKERISK